MKKLLFAFFALALIYMTAGCVNFTGTQESIWGDGLWIIPTLTGAGAAIFGYKAWKDSHGPFYNEDGTLITDKTRVPLYKIGFFYFFIALVIATILIITNIVSER